MSGTDPAARTVSNPDIIDLDPSCLDFSNIPLECQYVLSRYYRSDENDQIAQRLPTVLRDYGKAMRAAAEAARAVEDIIRRIKHEDLGYDENGTIESEDMFDKDAVPVVEPDEPGEF